MKKLTREQSERDIFDSAPILFRWKDEAYLDPEDAYTEEDLKLHAEWGIKAESQLGRFTPVHYYGIECGDGWLPLVKKTLIEIETILEKQVKSGLNREHLPAITQIKQKFGYLRIAMRWLPNEFNSQEIREIINQAENKSRSICENCGVSGLDPHRKGMDSRCGHC